MQSSLEYFCEECGAANAASATHCFACNEPLSHAPDSLPAPIRPVVVAPPTRLAVTAGSGPVTPGPLASSSETLKPGTLLQGRYRILAEIGQGGYSVVYKALDTARRNRQVVVKQINMSNLTSRQVIEATETFNRETTVLPVLRHEGIPRFYEHFTDPEHWYLVMEFVPGMTLETYLQNRKQGSFCSLQETLRIGIELCTILEYLHSCRPPLIFRDVKPANIMITPRGKLYLIDFGIARSFAPAKAKDTTPLGSPGYAAPEQYGRGQSNARTDIYGLGMTLQTLLTGRDPLELRAGEPALSPHPIPEHVQKLLSEMTNPESLSRPASMAIVRERLQKSLARVRSLASLSIGLILGLVYVAWGYLTYQGMTSYYPYHYYFLHQFAALSLCLWGVATAVGVVAWFIALFLPSKRFIALGVLGVGIVAFLLIYSGLLPF